MDDQQRASTHGVRLVVDRPGQLIARVDAPGTRVLAFTERFDDGWSATIDDVPARTVRVEEDFLGCIVTAGVHRVDLRFMPRSFVYGSIVSAIGVVLLAAVVAAGWR
ncbi:MAG: YfhO family protein [Acidobacteria bacterium]|nr:YfhO family protein [Acidobacteriota bacterium]